MRLFSILGPEGPETPVNGRSDRKESSLLLALHEVEIFVGGPIFHVLGGGVRVTALAAQVSTSLPWPWKRVVPVVQEDF